MVYFRLSALGLTAVAVLTAFLVVPAVLPRDEGPNRELLRAYANHRKILVETGVIAGVRVDGDRLLVTPGPRWYEPNDEMQRLHAQVLAEGLLGNREAPWVLASP